MTLASTAVNRDDSRGPTWTNTWTTSACRQDFAWCAAFVFHCFAEAAFQLDVPNPCPCTASALHLFQQAPSAAHVELPAPGDVFVLVHPDGIHGHCGFVLSCSPGGDVITSIEGDTNATGSSTGDAVGRHVEWTPADGKRGRPTGLPRPFGCALCLTSPVSPKPGALDAERGAEDKCPMRDPCGNCAHLRRSHGARPGRGGVPPARRALRLDSVLRRHANDQLRCLLGQRSDFRRARARPRRSRVQEMAEAPAGGTLGEVRATFGEAIVRAVCNYIRETPRGYKDHDAQVAADIEREFLEPR